MKDNLNDSITQAGAIGMLAQHLITAPVFEALFAGHGFAASNPISQTMTRITGVLGAAGLDAETQALQGFYESVGRRAAEVTTAAGKQALIAELYEKFFQIGFRRDAEALGIVFTPVEVVDFILRAADDALRAEFGRGLTDEGVHILDPFTGTGTFMTRLLQSGLIKSHDLARKYATELHANEIMLLAYYIAAVNIETTYAALTSPAATTYDAPQHVPAGPSSDNTKAASAEGGGVGSEEPADARAAVDASAGAVQAYQPFEGIVLADTFQITEAGDSFDTVMFPANNERITTQLAAPITVIIGNPPYSVGQASANDLNANVAYPTLDGRIAQTYAKRSMAVLQRSLYDSYLRAFRWATDRIGESGVVAFVSNGGWIDSNSGDGIRLSLADEYSKLYVYNLRGNSRTAGELAKREGGNVFNVRVGISIVVAIKNPLHSGPCEIRYRDAGHFLKREQKLDQLTHASLSDDAWTVMTPNEHGDWINQRDEEYGKWPAIGGKGNTSEPTVFTTYSGGLKTNRDAWIYNYSKCALSSNVRSMIDFYNQQVGDYDAYCQSQGVIERAQHIDRFIDSDPTKISWTRGLKQRLRASREVTFKAQAITTAMYRPFSKQLAYVDNTLVEVPGQTPSMFPTMRQTNLGFYVVNPGSAKPFSVLMTDLLPDLAFWGSNAGQFFPRWTYEKADAATDPGMRDFAGAGVHESAAGQEGHSVSRRGGVDEYGYRRVDNITEAILARYREHLGTSEVTKDAIFYYVYGLLHDPAYREKYAADLKKMLPHIPDTESYDRFKQYAAAGRALAELHVGYEEVEPYPVEVVIRSGANPADRKTWRVTKMRWTKKGDHTTLTYNAQVTITGIPEEAQRYMLGSRSAIDWLIDRYQVKTDKASGIINDPNDWCDEVDSPRYIADLIARIATVAVETMKIVDSL